MKTKTCGRETSCALVLEHSTVSRLHARIELADDGLVCVLDSDSQNGTFLKRNDHWVRIRKATLCIGDCIRFGDIEVSLDRLIAVFGQRSNARLEARHFPARHGIKASQAFTGKPDHGPVLHKPRRNPATGKIEEDRPSRAS